MAIKLPQVVLVGRINTGKSTLFNTLTDTTNAIVSPTPGTTRDLNFARVAWRTTTFTLVDTGGLDAAKLGRIEQHVEDMARQAITDAKIIVLVMDGRHDLTAADRRIVQELRKNQKKIVLAISKIDGPRLRKTVSSDFYKLGLGDPLLVSGASGSGTGDLLDHIVTLLPTRIPSEETTPDLRLSIIGKTNVGKSSILNAILGEERVIVTPIPHTTRETNDINISFFGKKILLIDTAGLRKKRKLTDEIEKLSVEKTIGAIDRSSVSLLVTDVSQPLSVQDQVIAQHAIKSHNSIIIVANKWDLVADKDTDSMETFTKYYRRQFPGLDWAPIMFTSATTRQRLLKLIRLALDTQKNRHQLLNNQQLQSLLKRLPIKKAKPGKGTKSSTLIRLVQTATDPPAFSLQVRHTERLHLSYVNLLQKKMREKYDFTGTPISISLDKYR